MSFLDEIIKENQKLVEQQQIEIAKESKEEELEWWLQDWYLNGLNREGEKRTGYKCQLCPNIEFNDRATHKRHMREAHGCYRYFGDLTID